MRFRAITLLALAGLMLVASSAANAAAVDDAVKAIETTREAAWNAHDAHGYAQSFTADAVSVTSLGWRWKSRAEIERKLTDAFSFVFARSTLRIDDVSVRSLSDDIAIAYVTWSMTGAKSPDGSGNDIPQHGMQTQVLQKAEGRWLITSSQDTDIVPERAFPKAAPPVRKCLLASRDGKCIVRK